MDKERRCFLLAALSTASLLMAGCVQTSIRNINSGHAPAQKRPGVLTGEIELLNEPYEYAGLKETENIKSGSYTVVKARFPEDLYAEFFPGRLKWHAWIVNPSTGQEFHGQAMFAGLDENLDPFCIIIIDGNEKTGLSDDSRYILLSSGFTYGYTVGGTEFSIDASNFSKSPEYRTKVVLREGEEVGNVKHPKREIVKRIISDWNYFQSTEGFRFYTPLTKEHVRAIASINSQYDFVDKFIARSRAMISLDYISSAVSLAFDVVNATTAPSAGWDYDSVITRRQMGFSTNYIAALYRYTMMRELKKQRGGKS